MSTSNSDEGDIEVTPKKKRPRATAEPREQPTKPVDSVEPRTPAWRLLLPVILFGIVLLGLPCIASLIIFSSNEKGPKPQEDLAAFIEAAKSKDYDLMYDSLSTSEKQNLVQNRMGQMMTIPPKNLDRQNFRDFMKKIDVAQPWGPSPFENLRRYTFTVERTEMSGSMQARIPPGSGSDGALNGQVVNFRVRRSDGQAIFVTGVMEEGKARFSLRVFDQLSR
jgi:hypothetical protein